MFSKRYIPLCNVTLQSYGSFTFTTNVITLHVKRTKRVIIGVDEWFNCIAFPCMLFVRGTYRCKGVKLTFLLSQETAAIWPFGSNWTRIENRDHHEKCRKHLLWIIDLFSPKGLKVKWLNNVLVSYFLLHKMLIIELELCKLIVDHFLSAVW